ncbi:hypothetical protein [Arenibaculum sp.]|jgi:hypothetical protein|uniref:hypothetical protein n=1 Tax=Arenibaculum sp. TaxID=2865862 RepID=UPI002E107A93|nr:hypothetical protein [Arenibaculum sp.]
MRFELADAADLGLDGFFEEQRLRSSADNAAHFVKFDNAINELDVGSEFRRLAKDERLSTGEIRLLADRLAEGIRSFCNDSAVGTIIGVPNDAALARWYARLCSAASMTDYLIGMRETRYHTRNVLVIHRL